MPLPEIRSRNDSARQQDEPKASFMGVFGFSILGLLLCCLVARMPVSREFLSTKVLLIFMAAPVAAWLGFTLGGE